MWKWETLLLIGNDHVSVTWQVDVTKILVLHMIFTWLSNALSRTFNNYLYAVSVRYHFCVCVNDLKTLLEMVPCKWKCIRVNGAAVAHMHSCTHVYTNTHSKQTNTKGTNILRHTCTHMHTCMHTCTHTHACTCTHINKAYVHIQIKEKNKGLKKWELNPCTSTSTWQRKWPYLCMSGWDVHHQESL